MHNVHPAGTNENAGLENEGPQVKTQWSLTIAWMSAPAVTEARRQAISATCPACITGITASSDVYQLIILQ